MAIAPLKRIISLFCPKLRQSQAFGDVLAMYEKGNIRDAYATLCNVMENQPQWSKDGDVYTLWAELELLANHDPRKAIELLDKAQDVGCSEMGYYYMIHAEALWEAGEREMALQYFEKSVAAADASATKLANFAQALSCIHDKRAMRVWQCVLEKDPENCMAHTYVGWEAAKAGERDKAILMAKRAEELHPSVEEVADIGRLYHELEEFKTAINKYLEAKKLGYEERGLLNAAIGDCYLSLGEAGLARKYLKRAMRFNPENEYVKEIWREYEERFSR